MSEKNQSQQNAEQRQKELLVEALERARQEGGILLNAKGRTVPALYPKGTSVSAFNSLILSLHSDRNGFRTALYTPFSGAKKRGESVQTGEKGVPFVWYKWNGYQSKADKGNTITREEYNKLPENEKKGFSAIRDKEIRMLFNIEQTTLPLADKEAFEKVVKEHGTMSDRGVQGPEDKQVRIDVNRFLQQMNDNLVTIRKDGTGLAHYEPGKDVVHLPAQKHFPSYGDYVQEAIRQVVSVTGHPQRLGRAGTETVEGRTPSVGQRQHERLVVELASAVKMSQLGLPARLSPESREMVDDWKKAIDENPRSLSSLEADINNALGMMTKAERGEKIEKRQEITRPQEQTASIKADVSMLRDDNGKWALFIKPENEKGFAVYPDKADIGRFFSSAKQGGGRPDDKVRQNLAQKYYAQASAHPETKADLFHTQEKDIDLSAIERVSIVRTKSAETEGKQEDSKIMCYPVIKGVESIEPREVSPSQWQRMWLSEDKADYKRNLAATLFADILRQQNRQEEKRMNSPEQKAKEEREEKAKEVLTRVETKAIAAVVAAGITVQEEQSRGFHR